MSAPFLQVENVSKRYSIRSRVPFARAGFADAVRDVSFSVTAGETFALVGESGCGKSTLARVIACLTAPSAGRVVFEGRDLTALGRRALLPVRRRLQILLQDHFAALDPRMTAGASLAEPLAIHDLPRGPERVAELLAMVHLEPSLADRHPHELSGGQRQRVAIARALAVSPALLVLDEPLSALDLVTQARILELLAELQARLGLTYVFISHDLRVVRRIAGRIAVMSQGRLVELAETDAIFRAPGHAYTRALLDAAGWRAPGM